MSRRKHPTEWLGATMRAHRRTAGFTIARVAFELHVATNTVRCWESGRRCPAVMDLDRYLRLVGATLTLGGKP